MENNTKNRSASNQNKATKEAPKLTLEEALKKSSQLEKRGFTISATIEKEIVNTVARELVANN